LKSTPVCRMALVYVSPSIPTHAAAAADPPLGEEGTGTVNCADTVVNLWPEGGEVSTPPAQFELYWTLDWPAVRMTGAGGRVRWLLAARAARRASRPWPRGAANEMIAKRMLARAMVSVFIVEELQNPQFQERWSLKTYESDERKSN
jgi:hypothetical protein